ncbi:DNA-methyltransferase [Paenibacillus chitinolyticus]
MKVDQIIQGNTIEIMPTLPEKFFHCCVTSPPYWGLRDYGLPPTDWPEMTYTPMPGLPQITVPAWTGCLGLEPTPEMFVAHMVLVFREVWRVLRDDGTLWMNFGDSYASTTKGSGGKGKSTLGVASGGNGISEAGILRSQDRQSMETRKFDLISSGLKTKDLIGIPWRVAFALQADGWYLRSDIIWSKPNPMPESVRDRPTKAHEYIFLLSKSERYYYDKEAIKEPGVQDEWANGFRGGAYIEGSTFDNQEGGKRKTRGNFKIPAGWDIEAGSHGTIHRQGRARANSFARNVNESPKPGEVQQHRPDREPVEYSGMRNKRSVWTVATQPFPEAHFATFPEKLPWTSILAGSPHGGVVFDPFMGSGTSGLVARKLGRKYVGIDLNPEYIKIAESRIRKETAQMNIFEFGT